MNEDGITDRRSTSGGMRFRGHFEKKHDVTRSFLPMDGDASPSGNIKKALAWKASVPHKR
jgi:hypothetical protein